jgi:ketosteroid isomerase-like protein
MMDVKRRELLGAATAAAVLATGTTGSEVMATPSARAAGPAGDPERLKRIVREQRAKAQMASLPCAIPGEESRYDPKLQTPLVGFAPKTLMVSNDSPLTPGMSREAMMQIGTAFPRQALGPTFLSYGPMLADGNTVVEEWESQIYGADGTLYNNQYLWVLGFAGDEVISMHEYNDTQHAAIAFGRLGKWPELKPPTSPRRRNQHGVIKPPPLPASEVETVFEVIDRFDLNPRMLVDPIPSGTAPPVKAQPGIEGNKTLIRGLNRALASGNQAMVNSFYGKGFRWWIGGEDGAFGWNHLPRKALYAPLVQHLASPLTLRFGPMVADETRVFQQMDSFGRLDDGTVYNNWHAFVHEIRDGRIVQTREYHDPRNMWVVLGRFAPWGATPPAPRSRPRRSNLQGIATTIQYPTGGGPDLERWKAFEPLPA